MPLFLTVRVHHQGYNSDTRKSEKIISKAIPKSTSLTELAYQKDLLSPVDLEFFRKKLLGTYLA
jgi:hypothetical protein